MRRKIAKMKASVSLIQMFDGHYYIRDNINLTDPQAGDTIEIDETYKFVGFGKPPMGD